MAGRLPEEPRLLDLGAGTGSLFRFAAPIIARPQSWIFADADSFLLGRGLERTVEWARGRGFAARRADGSTGPALTLNAPGGPWRIETLVTDLAQAPRGLPLSLVDAVVCSALLDLTSRAWMERLFGGLALPFYAGMNVDGQDAWLPRHPADLAVRTAFRGDQRRDKGLGPALGNLAVDTAMQLLGSGGFETCVARSDWQISRGDAALAGTLVEMTAQPARRAMPAQAAKFTRWATARSRQAQASRLSIRIGHRDLLAFPPKG